jgi:hypothetical protein
VGEMGTARARPGHRMEHDLLGELAVDAGAADPQDATATRLPAGPPTTITGGTA